MKMKMSGDGAKEKIRSALHDLEIVRESGGYECHEAFINLPHDEDILRDVRGVAHELAGVSLRKVFLVGIGGSSLGAEAIARALKTKQMSGAELIVLDTLSEADLKAARLGIKTQESVSESAVVLASKSGTTTETIANFEILYGDLRERFGDAARSRIVAVTVEGSLLWQASEGAGFLRISMPRMVSGRFSVFSAVGLLPLALLGIDVEAVLSGARGALSLARDKGEEENGTQQSAMRLYQALQNGYDTHNLFLFHKELEGIGKWWRQLVGESLNKGGKGILPMVSIGSTDMHSMAQAYLGGPQHIFHTFVAALAESSGDTIPRERVFPELVPELSREDLNVLMRTILGGVEASFSAHGVPYDRVSLLSISPEALGNFMQTQMIETFILSRLMEVSCFDQPDVEAYKEETRQILVV